MNIDAIVTERRGHALVLGINTPGKRNAVTRDTFQALRRALDEAATNADIGAIIITGVDGYFSSGGDLQGLLQRRQLPPAERRTMLEHLHQLIRTLDAYPKPVIAAVSGGAAGAGFSLALACDLLIADNDATFSIAYIKVGLTPDGGISAFLGQQIPRTLLLEWALTGDKIPATRLYELGVINRLTDPGDAREHAIELAEQLCIGPARASATIKTLVRQAAFTSLTQQLDAEAEAMVAAQSDPESDEGISAFLEKRTADFQKLRVSASASSTESRS